MWCNVGFANNFEYICSFETYFKTSDINDWKDKHMRFKIYNSGKTLKMYDYETEKYYDNLNILINNQDEVVASITLSNRINSFVLNKNTLYAKFSNMYYDDRGGGEYSIGKCN